MPFDGVDFPIPRPEPPRRRPKSEDTVLALIALLAVAMLVLPVSLTSLVDLIQYLQHR